MAERSLAFPPTRTSPCTRAPRPILRLCTTTCATLMLFALTTGVASAQAAERREVSVSWELLWQLPPSYDSPVLAPALLVGDGAGGAVTFDYGDGALKRITSEGLDWAVGREGQGPAEFQQVMGISGAGEEIWVMDPGNRRLTRVAVDGGGTTEVLLPEVTRAIRLPDGTGVGLNMVAGPLLKVFDSEGNVTAELSPEGFPDDISMMVREGWITGGTRTPNLLVGFLYAGHLVHGVPAESGVDVSLGSTIEPWPFPELVPWRHPSGATIIEVDPESPEGARWVDHDATFFYVAYAGTTRTDARLVDLYLTEDATYWGSLILPEDVAYGAIVDEGVMAGVIFEPIPHIKVWRFSIADAPASAPTTKSASPSSSR